MNSKKTKFPSDEPPITLPLAALLSTESLGGGVVPTTDNLGTGLAEYIGWRMIQEDLKK